MADGAADAAPLAQAEAQKAKLPDDCELPPGAEIYWDAFWECSTDRPPTLSGIPQIPFESIDRYARRYGIEGEDFEFLKGAVRAADGAFVDVMAKKIETVNSNGK